MVGERRNTRFLRRMSDILEEKASQTLQDSGRRTQSVLCPSYSDLAENYSYVENTYASLFDPVSWVMYSAGE